MKTQAYHEALNLVQTNNEMIQVFNSFKNEIDAPVELARLYQATFDLTIAEIETFRFMFNEHKASLPTVSTSTKVYRGVYNIEAANGLSWSLSREVAQTFGPNVIELNVEPYQVLCLIGGKELEVVVDVFASDTSVERSTTALQLIRTKAEERFKFINTMINSGLITRTDALVKYALDIKELALVL